MDKAHIFFTSYNNIIKAAYEKAMKESEKILNKGMPLDEDMLHKYVDEAAERWELQALKELGDISPAQYIKSVETLSKLLDMFNAAPVICDEGLPAIYEERLKSFGNAAIDALYGIADRPDAIISEEEEVFLPPLMAIRLLGDWKISDAVPRIISFLDRQGVNYDIFAEEVKASLVSIGAPAIAPVMKAIETRDMNSVAVEYLLLALSEAGADNKSEEIFKFLKNIFRSKENKVFTAVCLKEYGDGRAIPAMLGYIDRNRDKLSREDYFEIVSAISALGGNTEELY